MKRLLGVVTLLLFVHILIAQPPITEQQARAELDKLGLEEDEVKRRMLEKGYDLDNVDPNDPGQLLEIEKALQEVVAELQAEKAGSPNPTLPTAPPPNPNPEPVPEQVIKDTTEAAIQEIRSTDIKEDVAEQIIESFQESLPESVIYGQQVFRDKSLKIYRQSEDIKPPDSYILGVGDIVAVSIWGVSQEGGVYEINKSGFISPQRMPRIYLKGISLGKAKDLLQRRFSNYYNFRPEQFELTINYSRTITVNIVGEVINYGSFNLPAINTAFNALVAAGGPSDIGSVRNIQLIRAGSQPRRIDVYEFLLDPNVQNELYLQENDYIHVPIAERLVTINGAVKKPFTFELVRGEELKALVHFAGGFTKDAYKNKIQIRRLINDEERIIDLDFTTLENNDNDFQLLNGDIITVQAIAKPYKNFVEIQGAVDIEGRFELLEGMRVSELITKAKLKESARRDVAYMQRSNTNGTVRYQRIDLQTLFSNPGSSANLTLEPKDRIIIYAQEQFIDQADFSVVGSVRNQIKLPFSYGEEVRISDAILLAGGLEPDATPFGFIRRINPANRKENQMIRVDIESALRNPNNEENIALQPFDELRVYSVETYTEDATMSINGAVRNPRSIKYAANTSIKDMIDMAEGLKPDATSFGYIQREDTSNPKRKIFIRVDLQKEYFNDYSERIILEPFDQLNIYSKTLFTDDEASISVSGAVRNPGTFAFAENFSLKDVLTMAGGLRLEASQSRIEVFRIEFKENQPTETIVATVEVDDSLNIISSGGDFNLAPFDLVAVRTIPEFELQNVVTINGEVKYPGDYPLIDNNERLLSIIQRAGGLSSESFPGGATLFRAQDDVGYIVLDLEKVLKNRKHRSNFILKRGDIIVIPKQKDLVTINGATKANELYPEKVIQGGKINVAYKKGKNAKWYVDHYAAGVGENGQRKRITVEHPNGEIERTKNFLFFKDYPSVREGSIVTVGAKPPKPPKEEGEKEDREKVDWGRTLADGLAQATAVLSLILLVQQINR